MVVALSVLLGADLLLALAVPVLPEFAAWTGIALLLGGFGLILTAGITLFSKYWLVSVQDYFSAPRRWQRKTWSAAARYKNLQQLRRFKSDAIAHFNGLRRKRALAANDRKHIKSLAKSVAKQLTSAKPRLPRKAYRQWQQEYRHYRRLQDVEGLLRLQLKIDALENL